MSPLERRCRTLLRAYPRWYRRRADVAPSHRRQPDQRHPDLGPHLRAGHRQRTLVPYGLLGLGMVAAAWFAPRLVVAVLAVFYVPLAVVPLIIQGLVALWAFVDARPAMAMAICIACTCVVYQTLSTISYGWAVVSPGPGLFIFVAAAVVLACGSFWLLRRRAVL